MLQRASNTVLAGPVPVPSRYVEGLGYLLAKRCTDIVLGTLFLLLTSPILLVGAVIIKVSSRGPVFYFQTRAGKDGQIFWMWKLRTMRADAELETGAVWAVDNDPRVIPTCRWMRHSHVDELPQLINVLLGHMSLVGPRPERPEILAGLAAFHPATFRRLAVMPGITGLAQIRWGYDTTPERFRRKLDSDLEYIKNRSWATDMRIMLSTLPKFILG